MTPTSEGQEPVLIIEAEQISIAKIGGGNLVAWTNEAEILWTLVILIDFIEFQFKFNSPNFVNTCIFFFKTSVFS